MKILAFDIGGTSIKSAIANCQDNKDHVHLENKQITNFNSENPSSSIYSCIKKYSNEEFDYVAVSATGVINKDGVVVATNGKIADYLNINIKSLVESLTNKRTIVVNDVVAIGYAEINQLRADEVGLVIALGTGIGGCLIYHNQILEGASGAFAEIGQLALGSNTFEELASTKALVNLAINKYKIDISSGVEFFERYKSSIDCQACLNEWVSYLACGIEQLLYCYNPDTIIIAGGISVQHEIIIPKLKAKLSHLPSPYIKTLEIVVAKQRNDAGIYGAVNRLRREIC